MKITMPVTLTAADAESRIIAGRIVQWNAEGNTSAGATMFEPNSIKFSKNVKLVLQHDQTRPLGKLMEWSEDETGITASFKIAKTTAGNDALEEAATGLRSDFSVVRMKHQKPQKENKCQTLPFQKSLLPQKR